MYKIGNKVKTDFGICTIVSKYEELNNHYVVDFKGERYIMHVREIKPHKTAHEKLIEMGYELTKRSDYVFYRHDDLPRVTIYSDKTYSCSDTNLVLSRILTQYLEELNETTST